jgi:hypothetical protein
MGEAEQACGGDIIVARHDQHFAAQHAAERCKSRDCRNYILSAASLGQSDAPPGFEEGNNRLTEYLMILYLWNKAANCPLVHSSPK